jgi:hypothetical protein
VLLMQRFGVQLDTLTLKQLAGISLAGGVTNAMAYLKSSPLPPLDSTQNEKTDV